MGQNLWVSNLIKENHHNVIKTKELLLNETPVSKMLLDKSMSERDIIVFLDWFIKAIRTGNIRLEHDFHLITDYNNVKDIQSKVDSVNTGVWKKPNKRFLLTELPLEYQKLCLMVYRKKCMSPFSIYDTIKGQSSIKLMHSAIGILVKNDILAPVPILENEYTHLIPNKYMITPNGAEEIIALKGQMAKEQLVIAEPTPSRSVVKKPKKTTVSKRVVGFINSIF